MAGPGHIILQACCWLFEAKPARLSILFLFVISDSRSGSRQYRRQCGRYEEILSWLMK